MRYGFRVLVLSSRLLAIAALLGSRIILCANADHTEMHIPDRIVVFPAKTYLVCETSDSLTSIFWSKVSGPGEVEIENDRAKSTSAVFSTCGQYVLHCAANDSKRNYSKAFKVDVVMPASKTHLHPIPISTCKINSPFWNERIKMQIVNWIPHCIKQLEDTSLKAGIQNFVEAGNKLAGRPYQYLTHDHPWTDSYVLKLIEAMCLSLMIDNQSDAAVAKAQNEIRNKLEEWIPILLSAQEPDGYLQTRFTLGYESEKGNPPPRWTRQADHEGYIAGYFMEAAIAHYYMSKGTDRRLYDSAKKMADCWERHLGAAPKTAWYSGHQELELALVRFARLVNEVEGNSSGEKYIRLAKFFLDIRGVASVGKANGRITADHEQNHIPLLQQYEAVGHAVRAVYCYTAMTDLFMETGDAEYESSVKSIWDNLVNKKYYITGGIGTGEDPESFGKNYSLRNNSYCETCSSCGQIFFQNRMNLAFHHSRYADLLEETLYNALLGAVDLSANNFTYTNPLDQSHIRYKWHACPCCVANIPRTVLELPTWMYSKNDQNLYINLYIGSTVQIGAMAGCNLQVEQRTDYPWNGKVDIILNPSLTKAFTLHLRIPDRTTSALYQAEPDVNGISSIYINGKPERHERIDGYAVITREWKASDKISFVLPLQIQRIRADQRIEATKNKVALRYGPLIYNIESVDQNLDAMLHSDAKLTAQWEPSLLGGVIAIRGTYTDGTPLCAIPNYARMNREGRSIVWINEVNK